MGAERSGPETFQGAMSEQECWLLSYACCVDPLLMGSSGDLAEFNRGTRVISGIALVVCVPWLWLFVGWLT